MKLEILEPSTPTAGPILVCDEAHNDIAEFFHSDHATVGQSYETALMLARNLVEVANVGNVIKDNPTEKYPSWFWYGRYEGSIGGYVPPSGFWPSLLYWIGNCVGRRFGPSVSHS